jgi:hypothetical protein
VLLLELLHAVAPAAARDAGGHARVDPGRVHGDGGPETLPDDPDAIGIHLGPCGEVAQRVLRVLDLLEADHAPAPALALAAAAHVEPQPDVAERREHRRRRHGSAAVLVASEPVKHEEAGPAWAWRIPVGDVQHPCEPQAVGLE